MKRRELLFGASAASLVQLVGCGGDPPPVIKTPGPIAPPPPREAQKPVPPGIVLAYFGQFDVEPT